MILEQVSKKLQNLTEQSFPLSILIFDNMFQANFVTQTIPSENKDWLISQLTEFHVLKLEEGLVKKVPKCNSDKKPFPGLTEFKVGKDE